MKTEKLFELLAIVDGVKSTSWNMVMELVDCISEGSVDVREKKWADQFKQSRAEHYPLDLSKINTWSTFDNTCIELRFYIVQKDFFCDARIFDGDSFGGRRLTLRFTAKLQLPYKFIHEIENLIEYRFEVYLETLYEAHLFAVKEDWINKCKSEILNLK